MSKKTVPRYPLSIDERNYPLYSPVLNVSADTERQVATPNRASSNAHDTVSAGAGALNAMPAGTDALADGISPAVTSFADATSARTVSSPPVAAQVSTAAPATSPISTDTIIIGAGPIGIEVAIALKELGHPYLHLEAGAIGHFMTSWSPNTTFFSSPEWIAIGGVPIQTTTQRQITAEQYLTYLRSVVEIKELAIRTFERVNHIEKLTPQPASQPSPNSSPARFAVTTATLSEVRTYRCRNVVLATGNMQLKNRLNIEGEQLPIVHHHLRNPHYYFQRKLLIVGSRNSACEAALRCWRAGVRVMLCIKQPQLPKRGILDRLRLEIELLIKNQQIACFFGHTVQHIAPGIATLLDTATDTPRQLPIDFAYVAIGYTPDFELHHQLGVRLVGDERMPVYDDTMQTNVAGVYIAGTATGGHQKRHTVFITTCHGHAASIARAVAGKHAQHHNIKVGNIAARNYTLTSNDIE